MDRHDIREVRRIALPTGCYLGGGGLIVAMGMLWLGVAIMTVASVLYGVFVGKSRQTGTQK